MVSTDLCREWLCRRGTSRWCRSRLCVRYVRARTGIEHGHRDDGHLSGSNRPAPSALQPGCTWNSGMGRVGPAADALPSGLEAPGAAVMRPTTSGNRVAGYATGVDRLATLCLLA